MCLCASWRASLLVFARLRPKSHARSLVSLESDVRRALAHSWFYTTELVEKDSHNNTVAFRSPGIFERSWSRVCDRRRGDDPGCSQRSSDFAIPNQQLPMLRRALVTQPRQGKGVSCPAHYRLGCAQPCACPLPQLFSVPAREQVRLVQLRDGLRATPSLDVAAGRGVAVLFPEQRVGSHDGLAPVDVIEVGAS